MQTLDQLFEEAAGAHGIEAKDFSQPTGHYITAGGLRFHYVDWGGSGVPVLFLHGGNQTARTWDLVCLQLRDKYHCYALDQRNHGESARIQDSDAPPFTQREDIRAVVEELDLRDFVLVGMSLGGFNTMAYAAKYPERLRAVAIVDVSPTVQPQGTRQIEESIPRRGEFKTFEEAVEYSVRSNPRRSVAHLRYTLTFAMQQREDGIWTWKHQRPFRGERDGQKPQQLAQARAREAVEQRSALWDEVSKIPCPALIIRGGNSRILAEKDAERLLHTLPRASLVTVPEATHNVQGDKPKELAAALNRFLRTVA